LIPAVVNKASRLSLHRYATLFHQLVQLQV